MKHRIAADDDWLLWQLADSAFPAGGFAHSGGLEAAWQHGQVRNASELASMIEASLWQFGHASLPFTGAAYDEPDQLAALDRHCDAFLTNHVANRASRLQGRAFLSSAQKIFRRPRLPAPPCGHFAPVFGAAMRVLGLERGHTGRLFLFQHLRGLVAAAVRLGVIGPMEGQSMQHRLGPIASQVLAQCGALPVTEAAQTAPLLELWQGTQDRLYSRLFQS